MFIKADGASLETLREDIKRDALRFLTTLDTMYGNLTSLGEGWQSDMSAAAHSATDQKLIQAGRDLQTALDHMGIAVEGYTDGMAGNERMAASFWSA
jgi:uncharacterized protein YukE